MSDDIASLIIEVDYKGAVKASGALDRLQKESKGAEGNTKKLTTASRKQTTSMVALAAKVGGLALAYKTLTSVLEVSAKFETLDASLKTVTGSTEAATEAMANIREFATDLPSSVEELAESFIKLKALGLDPSEQAIKSYSNTAAAMGKNLNQMIEAVADASTGEFERLKEFGIKSKSEGDKVIFTFQGVATEVGKNSQEIQDYLLGIGEVQFAGAAADQMDTLKGATSNLGVAVDNLLVTIGEEGLKNAAKEAALSLAEVTKAMEDGIREGGFYEGAIRAVAELFWQMSGGEENVLAGMIEDTNMKIGALNQQIDQTERRSGERGLIYKWFFGDEQENEEKLAGLNEELERTKLLLADLEMQKNVASADKDPFVGPTMGGGEEDQSKEPVSQDEIDVWDERQMILFDLDKKDEARTEKHQAELDKIVDKHVKERKKKEREFLSTSISLAQQGNTSMTNLVKQTAIDQAKILGAKAVVNAYEWGSEHLGGPVGGAVAAAAASLAVGGLISKISAGGGDSGGISSGVVQAPEVPTAPTAADAQDDQRGQTVIQIETMIGNEEFVRDVMVPVLADEIDNNDVVIISSGSRQAAEIS